MSFGNIIFLAILAIQLFPFLDMVAESSIGTISPLARRLSSILRAVAQFVVFVVVPWALTSAAVLGQLCSRVTIDGISDWMKRYCDKSTPPIAMEPDSTDNADQDVVDQPEQPRRREPRAPILDSLPVPPSRPLRELVVHSYEKRVGEPRPPTRGYWQVDLVATMFDKRRQMGKTWKPLEVMAKYAETEPVAPQGPGITSLDDAVVPPRVWPPASCPVRLHRDASSRAHRWAPYPPRSTPLRSPSSSPPDWDVDMTDAPLLVTAGTIVGHLCLYDVPGMTYALQNLTIDTGMDVDDDVGDPMDYVYDPKAASHVPATPAIVPAVAPIVPPVAAPVFPPAPVFALPPATAYFPPSTLPQQQVTVASSAPPHLTPAVPVKPAVEGGTSTLTPVPASQPVSAATPALFLAPAPFSTPVPAPAPAPAVSLVRSPFPVAGPSSAADKGKGKAVATSPTPSPPMSPIAGPSYSDKGKGKAIATTPVPSPPSSAPPSPAPAPAESPVAGPSSAPAPTGDPLALEVEQNRVRPVTPAQLLAVARIFRDVLVPKQLSDAGVHYTQIQEWQDGYESRLRACAVAFVQREDNRRPPWPRNLAVAIIQTEFTQFWSARCQEEMDEVDPGSWERRRRERGKWLIARFPASTKVAQVLLPVKH